MIFDLVGDEAWTAPPPPPHSPTQKNENIFRKSAGSPLTVNK